MSLIEILDAFERIFADVTIREEALSGAPKVWIGNFRTVYRLLAATLRELGVAPIEVRTRQFDPLRHRVVETVSDPGLPTGTIVRQEIRGYAWGGRILRKTGVVVASPARPGSPQPAEGRRVFHGQIHRHRPGHDLQRCRRDGRPQPSGPRIGRGAPVVRSMVGLRYRDRRGQARTEVLVGDTAFENWPLAPGNTIVSIKRLMGRGVADPEVQRAREWAHTRSWRHPTAPRTASGWSWATRSTPRSRSRR